MQLMLTGKPGARRRRRCAIGLVDRLVAAGDLRCAPRARWCCTPPAAAATAPLETAAEPGAGAAVHRSRALDSQVAAARPAGHYPAPYAMIELWARYGAHGAAAFEAEARSIAADVRDARPRAT